jgi:hypothetical protein
MNAVAVPHLADVIGDTDAIADCVLAKVRSCIGGWMARGEPRCVIKTCS